MPAVRVRPSSPRRRSKSSVCGICGVAFASRSADAESRVRAMTAAMRHRGPDEESILADNARAPGLALGMRRLSIIDLAGGHQPIWNETKDVAVIFNGELYNYRDLRERLALCGHRFATQSDTEVLVHAWEEWGEDSLTELQGMFAFALLDLRERYATAPILFLARDPLGIKPLYYTQTPNGFAFASEVRALLAAGVAPRELSLDAVTSYLLFGSVSEPVSMIEGVFSVPPGHRMLIHVPDRRRIPRARPWWDPMRSSAARETRKPANFSAVAQRLRPMLEDAVHAHLVADVPVGLFLSSGLDSGIIAALAARAHPGIRSLTLAFPGTSYDESPLARKVAEHAGTKHEEIPLDGAAVLARLDEALSALDQPTMDGINTYFVSWAAHEAGLKVALSGLGGDEIFGGYSTFTNTSRAALVAGLGRWVPGPLRRLTAGVAVKIAAGEAVRKAAAAWRSPEDFPHAYYFTRLLFTPFRMRRLLAPYFESVAKRENGNEVAPLWRQRMRETTRQARRLDSFNCVSGFELQTYMVNTLLRDTDAVSMANSLEVRVPLLDHRLVEFVARLPKRMKYIAGVPKALLVEALSDVLPDIVVGQAK